MHGQPLSKTAASDPQRKVSLNKKDNVFLGCFTAMASDCEVQFFDIDDELAKKLAVLAANETWRIQDKFSRYQDDSIVSRINHAQGKAVDLDVETAALIDYAFYCFQISDGLFDISSGILRRAWRFDGSDRIPQTKQISQLLPHIGLEKVRWSNPVIQVPKGMEIDLGGIGKEYAVDKVLQLLMQYTDTPIMVNFGGDLAANKPPFKDRPWQIGISDLQNQNEARQIVALHSGGIATSGDTQRFLKKDGIRYSHILNPKTGWPITNAPRSVTVFADSCTDAGILATLAMLKGKEAEKFLKNEGLRFQVQR